MKVTSQNQVGLRLCRLPDFLERSTRHSHQLRKGATSIGGAKYVGKIFQLEELLKLVVVDCFCLLSKALLGISRGITKTGQVLASIAALPKTTRCL